jgi:hypothetical protein
MKPLLKFKKRNEGWYARVPFSWYTVSIVAGEWRHSYPRTFLEDPFDYEAYEVAILDDRNGDFISPQDIKGMEHFQDYWSSWPYDTVASGVPSDAVASMLEDMLDLDDTPF